MAMTIQAHAKSIRIVDTATGEELPLLPREPSCTILVRANGMGDRDSVCGKPATHRWLHLNGKPWHELLASAAEWCPLLCSDHAELMGADEVEVLQ